MPDTRPATAAPARPTPARGRALRAAAVGVLAVGALAACEKPSPGVTVWSGTRSVHAEAVCWEDCTSAAVQGALSSPDAPAVSVISDSTVGISVDPSVADGGWYAAIGTSKLTAAPVTGTYYRFTFPAGQTFPAGGFPLEIVAVGQGDTPRGVWVFRLTDGGSTAS